MEAGHTAAAGVKAAPRVSRLIAAAQEIARSIDSPYAHGMIAMAKGTAALLFGQWNLARAGLDEAEQIFRNRCTGVAWERDTIHNFALWALLQLGDLTELSRRWTILYRESRDRGDRYAASILNTFFITMIKLARNEQLDSEADLEAAVRHGDGRMFNLENAAALEALVHYHLYRSDVMHTWRGSRRSGLSTPVRCC